MPVTAGPPAPSEATSVRSSLWLVAAHVLNAAALQLARASEAALEKVT
jgi:hypothetical protein